MFLGEVGLLGLAGSHTHLCGLIPSYLSPGTIVRTPADADLFPVLYLSRWICCQVWPAVSHELNCLVWGQQTFSVKVQIVSILGFVAHIVAATIIQLCCFTAKTAIDNA